MKKRLLKTDECCPIARSASLIGDRWTLLIVQDAFKGSTRFSEFHKNLGIARNSLAYRLQGLLKAGILELQPGANEAGHKRYVLTVKGRKLRDTLAALKHWDDQYASTRNNKNVDLLA